MQKEMQKEIANVGKPNSDLEKLDSRAVDIETNESEPNEIETNEIEPNKHQGKKGFYKSRGVKRIENVKIAMDDTTKNGKIIKWVFGLSILVCAWAYSLDSSTTYNYSVPATSSFNRHSMISTLGIATSIISAVMKPILGKISDLTSRPLTYIIVLVLYTIGYIIVASSSSISAYVIGEVFISVGGAGLDFLNDVIVGDLTPLKWRGFVGSMLSTPFIINTWFAGLIVDAILKKNWRWGYGMFAIIMPVVLTPAILVMIIMDQKAQKLQLKKPEIASSDYEKRISKKFVKNQWINLLINGLIEIDAFGLILLGFGWSLLLLPFSLYSYANNGWKNPSMIAMMVIGGVLLIFYTIYELFWCPYPSMPKRVLFNRTFICAVIIDSVYTLAGGLRSTYFSSFVWIVKDWSNKEWTYFNNTLTLALCVFGVVAGIIQRITHRYKFLQIFGLAIKIIGMGLLVRNKGALANTASLVWVQLLVGAGGAFSVVGSRVASQASVPHEDMSLVIGLLQLWSKIGSGIGSAIASPIWTDKMPKNLRKNLPESVSDAEVFKYYSNLRSLRSLPFDDPIRQGAIKAYLETTFYLFVPSLALSFIPFIAAFFQTNFFLGDTQNAIEDQPEKEEHENEKHEKDQHEKDQHEKDHPIDQPEMEAQQPKNWLDRVAKFYQS